MCPFNFGNWNHAIVSFPDLNSNAMFKTFFYLFLIGAPVAATAQNCVEMYDYFKVGASMEYTSYDKKGKIESVMTQRVSKIENNADTVVATIDMSGTDAKGKNTYQSTFPMKCHEGILYMDMRSVVPPTQDNDQMPDIQVEITGSDLTFPKNMEPGQTLPDAEMEMTMRMGGMQLMQTRYTIKNRKVEAKESVTTSAGTYNCVKISYDFEYKLMGTRTVHTEYWYSQAVGMVKSISYDKKGNEDSRMELTKFSKG